MMTFDHRQHIRQVVIVGLGGTGSQVARSVARMVYDMRQRNLSTPDLYLVDPDVIETKNVGRQMFTPADVGQNKAVVLARRFNMALGLQIRASAEMFNPNRHPSGHGVLLIGCVDNHEARCALADASGALWIDCGNAFDHGQVVIGNSRLAASVIPPASASELYWLPNAAALFPELLEPDPDEQPQPDVSCADLVQYGEQHLLINEFVALAAAGYVYKLLNRQPITSFMTRVNTSGFMTPVAISRENLLEYLPTVENPR